MLLNAIWKVPEENEIETLSNRSISVDLQDNRYGECEIWGKVEFYPHMAERDTPVLLRQRFDNHDCLIAMVDTPFTIEYWDTLSDERFNLRWDGQEWWRDKANDFSEDDHWTTLRSVDVETMISNVCNKLGLPHLSATMVRDRRLFIELVDRSDVSNLSLDEGHYYYRDSESNDIKYTMDVKELPDVAEIDVLQFVDPATPNNDYIKILFDEDLPLELVIGKISKLKESNLIGVLKSNSDDIIDARELVKHAITDDEVPCYFYVVHCIGKLHTSHRIFINMAEFYPKEAPYLV